jgi:hypothetical protein
VFENRVQRRKRWVGHVTRTGEMRNAKKKNLVRKPKGGGHSEDLDVDGSLIVDWILGK